MVVRVLALNKKGQFTYCTSPEELRGKGRCNHILHRRSNQSAKEFVKEVQKMEEEKLEKRIEIKLDENDMLEISYKGDIPNKEGKELLFTEENGVYIPTEYAKYIILSQGKKKFAALICDLDKEEKFHRESTAEVVNPEIYYAELKKYQENKKEFDALVQGWKAENLDKFQVDPFIPSIQRFARNFEFKSDITIEEAIQGYKYCNEMFKKLDKSKLTLSTKTVIKAEYKEEYTEVAKKYREKAGFPTESEIKEKITERVTERRTRLALNRQKFDNVGATEKFAKEYVNYLVESDFSPKEYDWNHTAEEEE